jgi:hypothetical protein
MSFQLGIAHLFLVVISLVVATFFRHVHPRTSQHVIFFIVLFGFLIFAMTSGSLVIWKMFPFLGFIQFPWRLLSLIACVLSFLCGGLFLVDFDTWVKDHLGLSFGNRTVQLGAIALLLLFTVGYCRVQSLTPLSEQLFSPESLRSSAPLTHEYLPIWVQNTIPEEIQGGEIQIVQGEAEIHDIQTDMLSYTFTIEATTPTTVRVGTVYFPGWKAYSDEQGIALEPEPSTGLLTMNISPGSHVITIRFENTPIRTISQYITLVSLGILAGLSGFHYITRRGKVRYTQRCKS